MFIVITDSLVHDSFNSVIVSISAPLMSVQYIRRRKRLFAHDETEKCIVGDVVLIKSCLPISKKKHYVVQEIVESAPRYVPPATGEEEQQQQTTEH